MSELNTSQEAAESVWRFVRPEDFETVAMPAAESSTHWLLEAWRNAKEHWNEVAREHQEPEELRRLSIQDLQLVAAPPRWEMACQALAEALGEWVNGESPEVRFVVGPPGSGVPHVVRALAQSEGWECLEPPSSEYLLEGGQEWLNELVHEVPRTESASWPLDQAPNTGSRAMASDFYRKDEGPSAEAKDRAEHEGRQAGEQRRAAEEREQGQGDSPELPAIRVLPRLERCFLRHASGLRVARRLLDACARGGTGPLLIGCGSWAWSYLACLAQASPREGTSGPASGIRSSSCGSIVVPQPFDVERMTAWLRREAERAPCSLIFRQIGTGWQLLRTSGTGEAQERPQGQFLEQLAGFSRGLPEVALAVWKESLRSRADGSLVEPEAAPTQKSGPSAERASRRVRTLWVQPWEDLALPKVPASAGRVEVHILHSLLLHGGLCPQDLVRVLPLEEAALPSRLKYLEKAGLVKLLEGRWWVRKRAYPAVRAWLFSRGVTGDGMGSS